MPEVVSGEGLWERYGEAVMGVEGVPDRLPALDFNQVRPLLAEEVARLRVAAPRITAHLSPEAGARWTTWLEDVPQLAALASWLRSQLDLAVEVSSEFHTLLEEAIPLRRAALWSMTLGESLGRIPTETAQKIRSGQGHLDVAMDLVALGTLLPPHWDLLGPLQTHGTPERQLTEAQLRRLTPLGDALIERQRLRDAQEPVGWRDRLRRCYALLALRWDTVRFAALGGWALAGDLEAAQSPAPSLHAMYHRR